ncbi:MAG: hypothetical protein ABL927_05295 [Bdellovibrionales bacterium]
MKNLFLKPVMAPLGVRLFACALAATSMTSCSKSGSPRSANENAARVSKPVLRKDTTQQVVGNSDLKNQKMTLPALPVAQTATPEATAVPTEQIATVGSAKLPQAAKKADATKSEAPKAEINKGYHIISREEYNRILSTRNRSNELANSKNTVSTQNSDAPSNVGTASSNNSTSNSKRSDVKKLNPNRDRIQFGKREDSVTISQPTEIAAPAAVLPTQEQPKAAPVEIKSDRTLRNNSLRSQIIFADDLDGAIMSAQVSSALTELWSSRNELALATRGQSQVVDDLEYEATKVSTPLLPIISYNLSQALLNSAACDISTVGSCLVIEKDSANKKATRAYFVGSDVSENAKRNMLYRVGQVKTFFRMDLDSSISNPKISNSLSSMLMGRTDGIYIYSTVANAKLARYLQKDAVDLYSETVNSQNVTSNKWATLTVSAETIAAKIATPKSQNEAEQIEADFKEAIAKSATSESVVKPTQNTKNLFNTCVVVSSLSDARYTNEGLRLVKQVFVLSPIGTKKGDSGQEVLDPVRIGKGRLICHLQDGTYQKVHVLIKDYQYFRVGFAMHDTRSSFFATGIGFANGALDILTIKKFVYPFEAGVSLPIAGINLTPLILNGTQQGVKFTLAGNVGFTAPKFMILNASMSLPVISKITKAHSMWAGHYEIVIDPDDT